MRNKIIFLLAALGFMGALLSAYVLNRPSKAQQPVFSPAINPYPKGIYANGIIESDQADGANINMFPEVPGRVAQILVHEGAQVHKGQALLQLDDSVQRATAEQLEAQAKAAFTQWQELKAEPRKEVLDIVAAQRDAARASLKTVEDDYDKQQTSYQLNPKSVSQAALDDARNARDVAKAALAVAERQYRLTATGAWSYDIANQAQQYEALSKSAKSAEALLDRYTLRAPIDGKVLALNAALGSYVSTQGSYNAYTQASNDPVIVMGSSQQTLAVRCYIDEVLIHGMPALEHTRAQMSVPGSDVHIPLQFLRMGTLVSPKIELSNQREERVDVRVLPVIFHFRMPPALQLYPGQLVDVYIAQD